MEISHTHYWSRDLAENVEHGLTPSNNNTAATSNSNSPFGSQENLASVSERTSVKNSPTPRDLSPRDSGDSRKSSHSEIAEPVYHLTLREASGHNRIFCDILGDDN